LYLIMSNRLDYFRLSKQRAGFTLVELLIVISIIVILATIGSLNFSHARAKARDAKRVGDLRQLQTGFEAVLVGEQSEVYPVTVPGSLNIVSPPRTFIDNYCYYRRGDGRGYYLAASNMETKQAEEGDQANGIVIQLGAVGINQYEEGLVIGTGTACLGTGQILDCNSAPVDNVYCLTGEQKL